MKITAKQLKEEVAAAVRLIVLEAKKKKKKKASKKKDEDDVEETPDEALTYPAGYLGSKKHDFSKPLGAKNIVRANGASGMGGWTSESAVRNLVRKTIAEEINRMKKSSRR